MNVPGIPLAWDLDDALAVFSKYPRTHHGIKLKLLDFWFPTAIYHGDQIDICSTTCMVGQTTATLAPSAID